LKAGFVLVPLAFLVGWAVLSNYGEKPPDPSSGTVTPTPALKVGETTTPLPAATSTPADEVIAEAYAVFGREAARVEVWGTAVSPAKLEFDSGKLLVVQYFEKGRMEYDPTTPTVTGGLLANKLLNGEVQKNKDESIIQGPPCRPMFDDSVSITYSTFSEVLSKLTDSYYSGFVNQQREVGYATIIISTKGELGIDQSKDRFEGAKLVRRVFVPGDNATYDIPYAFCGYLMEYLQSPSHWCDPRSEEMLPAEFWDLTGYPVSDPYWTTADFDGHTHTIMFQAFERRVLTYAVQVNDAQLLLAQGLVVLDETVNRESGVHKPIGIVPRAPSPILILTPTPTATPQVASANVGAHYLEWRYPKEGQRAWACPP
jgi:hypothetical protein